MKQNKFPPGWDEERVRRILAHYTSIRLKRKQQKKEANSMERIRKNITIERRPCWTLFDTGARNTYIVADVSNSLPKKKLEQHEEIAIGGELHRYDQICIMTALVEGKSVWTDACRA